MSQQQQQEYDDRVRRVVSARRSNNRNMLPSPRRIRKTNDSAQNILLRNALPTPLMSQRSYNRLEHDEMKQRMFERIDAAMRRNPPNDLLLPHLQLYLLHVVCLLLEAVRANRNVRIGRVVFFVRAVWEEKVVESTRHRLCARIMVWYDGESINVGTFSRW